MRLSSVFAAAALLIPSLVACSDDPPTTPDASSGTDAAINPDGGVQGDGGRPDGGSPDGGAPDTGVFVWPVPTATIPITPSQYWKNRITRDDPFAHRDPPAIGAPPNPSWVKFAVLMRDPSKVYFQDSNHYPFHYEFATEQLDPFRGKTREEMDRISLHEPGQEVILGAVLFPPRPDFDELGIQLVRQDPYHREMARIVLDLVRRSIDTSTATRAFYFPTFEQSASAETHATFFSDAGFPVSGADRWNDGDACYSGGWALGRLVKVSAAEIDTAYASGRLGPRDVLLTDGVPAEVPFVAGILSTAGSTPNSHVAILARSYGVPFAHLANPAAAAEVDALAGHDVVVRVETSFGACEVKVLDAQGRLDATQRTELLALKNAPPLNFARKERKGAYSASTEDLGPADVKYFGGKASNYGVLRDAIPANSPTPAIALSFDLWDRFLDQTLAGTQQTLRAAIAAKLSSYTYPPNVTALRTDLAAVRAMVEAAGFDAESRAAVIGALAPFNPTRRIRFRSSTNVEDAESFSGAGLYDSETGCLADDTDADELGPSACDATRVNERGVFRALKKVYRSFYFDNAFLERLRHGIDESHVGMGVLVHYSHPDADELANGVATVRVSQFSTMIQLVSQLGAVSVANPEGGARAELVEVQVIGQNAYPEIRERSSLVQLGATVMTYPDDYVALARILTQAAMRWSAVTGRGQVLLDLEYKKMRPGELVVKQIREIPEPDRMARVETFLLGAPTELCVFQGESSDVFANHRLKSRWNLDARSRWLRDTSTTFYAGASIDYLEESRVANVTGEVSMLPGFTHRMEMDAVVETFGTMGANARRWSLHTQVPRDVRADQSPIRALDDFYFSVTVDWAQPVIVVDRNGMQTSRTTDTVQLGRCLERNVVDSRTPMVERIATGATMAQRVVTRFHWPEAPRGATAGYTAPLHRWVETRIEGFTTAPIVLMSDWSQTYRPDHHNFSESFIFEPRLEPGLAAATLAELEAANIQLFVVRTNGPTEGTIGVVGTDGNYRALR